MKVVFVHLDLGIGGAEMLVVNAAVAAKKAGHEVMLYTSHHDQGRCFHETKEDGILGEHIRVRGNWIPRHLALGKFTALCAVMRMIWLSLCVLWSEARRRGEDGVSEAAVIFCDGVSAPVPLLRLAGPVLFYCHFPDKLLCVQRCSLLKRLYRWPLDLMEEFTTGCASSVAVNSEFTAGILREAFPRLGRLYIPQRSSDNAKDATPMTAPRDGKRRLRVLYPPTDVDTYKERRSSDLPPDGLMGPVVSLNRYERKKNLCLAVEALGWALRDIGEDEASRLGLRLTVAGGYDERVSENVQHFEELKARAVALGLGERVDFRTNVSDQERSALLRQASCVLYTPANEHFGIVPVEAMCSSAPVIAADSGGPLETVVHNCTGFLCPPTKEAFGSAIVKLAREPNLGRRMGEEGRRRVQKKFSMESFAGAFDETLREVQASGAGSARLRSMFFALILVLGIVSSVFAKSIKNLVWSNHR